APGLPPISADPAYATRALAVIVAQGIRTAEIDGSARPTRVRSGSASLAGRDAERVLIDVEYGSREVTRDELEMLFTRRGAGRGRGLTRGLARARSVIGLQGGVVEVEGGDEGGAVCHVWLPLVPPAKRPTLSSFPTLG